MTRLLALTALAFALAGTSAAQASEKLAQTRNRIETTITSTWYMQDVMGAKRTRTSHSYRRSASAKYIRWVARHWREVHRQVAQQYRNPPHYSAFMCIHRYEGSWQDGGSPYWGGLQMDYGFQSTYGATLLRDKGTADNWTPLEQIWTAEKAARSRGFYPWPNTARYCGLI